MNKSDTIGSLAAALAKTQADIKDAFAGTENTFLKSKYADLQEVLKVARPALAENELAVTQLVGSVGDDITVETMLMHSSGEWVSETLRLPVQVNKGLSVAQAMGSSITYARRYGLAAIVGISQDDTDATGQGAPTYTETHKAYFHKYVAEENALALYLFRQRVGDQIYSDLFNTFDKGEKVKGKDAARELESRGVDIFIAINEAIENNDADGVFELVEDDDTTVLHMLARSLGDRWKDCKNLIDSVKQGN